MVRLASPQRGRGRWQVAAIALLLACALALLHGQWASTVSMATPAGGAAGGLVVRAGGGRGQQRQEDAEADTSYLEGWKPPSEDEIARRCVGTKGDWCSNALRQRPIKWNPPPVGERTCLWNCEFGKHA